MAMKYNFDQLPNRLNTSSIKWDVKPGELPMWVADMDFYPMPEIQEAIVDNTNLRKLKANMNNLVNLRGSKERVTEVNNS